MLRALYDLFPTTDFFNSFRIKYSKIVETMRLTDISWFIRKINNIEPNKLITIYVHLDEFNHLIDQPQGLFKEISKVYIIIFMNIKINYLFSHYYYYSLLFIIYYL